MLSKLIYLVAVPCQISFFYFNRKNIGHESYVDELEVLAGDGEGFDKAFKYGFAVWFDDDVVLHSLVVKCEEQDFEVGEVGKAFIGSGLYISWVAAFGAEADCGL
jgi:hypothetical protein